MTTLNTTLLYVADPAASARFYAETLGIDPVESSPNFVVFVLPSGAKLGLWAAHDVAPAATPPGGSELGFHVADEAAVAAVHRDWTARGIPIVQSPTTMDFGPTFVARDPDGHRMRVYALVDA